MNQPEEPGAAEPDAEETESGVDETGPSSPLDRQVEGPINAAVHVDDQQGTEGG